MKEQIRSLILSLGADVCGFARTGRFADAPAGYRRAEVFSRGRRPVCNFPLFIPEYTDSPVTEWIKCFYPKALQKKNLWEPLKTRNARRSANN
jgi:hypothetical protein